MQFVQSMKICVFRIKSKNLNLQVALCQALGRDGERHPRPPGRGAAKRVLLAGGRPVPAAEAAKRVGHAKMRVPNGIRLFPGEEKVFFSP